PVLEKATTDGVVRAPSALGITTGSPASRTETTELVVPRSMPTALGMGCFSWCFGGCCGLGPGGPTGFGWGGSDRVRWGARYGPDARACRPCVRPRIKVECGVDNFTTGI